MSIKSKNGMLYCIDTRILSFAWQEHDQSNQPPVIKFWDFEKVDLNKKSEDGLIAPHCTRMIKIQHGGMIYPVSFGTFCDWFMPDTHFATLPGLHLCCAGELDSNCSWPRQWNCGIDSRRFAKREDHKTKSNSWRIWAYYRYGLFMLICYSEQKDIDNNGYVPKKDWDFVNKRNLPYCSW